jgi:hypothetical protein
MKSVLTGVGIAAIGLLLGSAAHAASFTNGSFEDATNFTPNGDNTESLSAGSTDMPGWTVTGAKIAWIGPTNPFGLTASDGDYFLDLTDYTSGNGNGVTQSFDTVVNGKYTVTFDLGGGQGVGLNASAGGPAQSFSGATLSTFTSWDSQSFSFVASTTLTALSFIGTSNVANYIGLDNVKVAFNGVAAITPIPASVLLFASALGGLGFAGWRRSKRAATA